MMHIRWGDWSWQKGLRAGKHHCRLRGVLTAIGRRPKPFGWRWSRGSADRRRRGRSPFLGVSAPGNLKFDDLHRFFYIVYLQTFSELSELFEFDGDALSDTSFTAWQLESSSVIPNFYYRCWWWRCNFYSDQPFLILSFLTYSTVISSISAFSHLEWPID